MNLVRLSFIVGMTSLAGYSLYLAVNRPYNLPIAAVVTTDTICRWSGGYGNLGFFILGFFILGFFAIVAGLSVACMDLSRRVY